MNIHRLTVEDILRQHIKELEVTLHLSQQHNANLIRHNAVLQELAANKTAYADQLRQALNRARSGNPEIKVAPECNGCRYLHAGSAANGWQIQCLAFSYHLELTGGDGVVARPKDCNGPYLPRRLHCGKCGSTDHAIENCHLDTYAYRI